MLLIDDHTLFRSGLQELLERRGIKVVAAVGDGEEGCKLAAELQPNVVLLDLRMPEIDGLVVLQKLNDLKLGIPIVMLTTSSDERDLVASLRRGAQGYLVKDMEPDQLIESLHEIVSGKTVVAPHMTGVLAKVVQGEEPKFASDARFSELTQREMDLARSIQQVCEEVMFRMARTVPRETGLKHLCLAGGVALNAVANGKILRGGPFQSIWIQPAACRHCRSSSFRWSSSCG